MQMGNGSGSREMDTGKMSARRVFPVGCNLLAQPRISGAQPTSLSIFLVSAGTLPRSRWRGSRSRHRPRLSRRVHRAIAGPSRRPWLACHRADQDALAAQRRMHSTPGMVTSCRGGVARSHHSDAAAVDGSKAPGMRRGVGMRRSGAEVTDGAGAEVTGGGGGEVIWAAARPTDEKRTAACDE
jgi:hypothetical protein